MSSSCTALRIRIGVCGATRKIWSKVSIPWLSGRKRSTNTAPIASVLCFLCLPSRASRSRPSEQHLTQSTWKDPFSASRTALASAGIVLNQKYVFVRHEILYASKLSVMLFRQAWDAADRLVSNILKRQFVRMTLASHAAQRYGSRYVGEIESEVTAGYG
jgi:hypothetical protein